jgi:methionyl-tRNA formyltransferase
MPDSANRHLLAIAAAVVMQAVMACRGSAAAFALIPPSVPVVARSRLLALGKLGSASARQPCSPRTAANGLDRFRICSSASDESAGSSDKARVVFLGTPDVAAASLRSIVEESRKDGSPFEVVGVVTQPPKRRKRRGKEIPSPVGLVAEELEISVLCPEKARDPDFLDELEGEVRPDLCITAAYGQYLPKRFLAAPRLGTLNIHPSILPRWRGASPVQRSLQAGDDPIGVTVLFTVAKMDAGPIVAQEEYSVGADEQATTVLPHLFHVGTDLLLGAMPDVLSGKVSMDSAHQQDEDAVVNASMIDSAEGQLIVWRDSATVCHNKCRGFSMWPGTFIYLQVGDDDPESADADEPVRVKILKTRVVGEDEEGGGVVAPTNLIEMGPRKKDGLRIVCGDGSVLEVAQLQPATKKAMDAKSFVNGLRGQTVRWVKTPDPENEDDM